MFLESILQAHVTDRITTDENEISVYLQLKDGCMKQLKLQMELHEHISMVMPESHWIHRILIHNYCKVITYFSA